MNDRVQLRDVTLRDGLQDEAVLATDDKLALFDALVCAGVTDLELTSFVRADRVPALADAADFAARTVDRGGDIARWALVLNERGAQRALAAHMDRLQFVVSVSESHSIGNAGRTPAAGLAEFSNIAAGLPAGVRMEVTLATAFGCPYEGVVAPSAVLAAAEYALARGACAVSLADTIGTAIPSEITALVQATVELADGRDVGVHLHDTRGLGVANALAALDAGARRIDGAVGGLGGCPFAPGASGNMALEDLVHVLRESGYETGIDLDALIEAAGLACALVGRPVGSHVGKAGPRYKTVAR